MTVLFVVPYVPSLIRARSYNLIRHLSGRGHKVILATLWSNDRERGDLDELGQYCDEVRAFHLPLRRSLLNCVRALPASDPLQAAYSWSAGFSSVVLSLRTRADIVHVEHLRGARYALCVQSHQTSSTPPVVWDSVDCISYLFDQAAARRRDRFGKLINRIELPRTRRLEGGLLHCFDRVLISSDADKAAMLALARHITPRKWAACPNGQRHSGPARHLDRLITVLPNGVDTDYFTPSFAPRDSGTLVFSGKMSYHANVSAAVHLLTDIMPIVWARRPGVRVVIVGKDPSRELRTLAARHSPVVTVTGTVADIRPFLRQATAAVIPLTYGAGSQFKVLEAMACAAPVIATPRAVSALKAEAGRSVLVAEAPQAFADAVLQLLDHPRRRRELGEAGRCYVETYHRWDRIAERLEAAYGEALAERRCAPLAVETCS